MPLVKHNGRQEPTSTQTKLLPPQPLWQRVPTRDEQGRLLGDFMMLMPHLKKCTSATIRDILAKVEKTLLLYQKYVMYVDFNLKTNTLWVSHRQIPGIGMEIAAAIHHVVPEAKLVAPRYE